MGGTRTYYNEWGHNEANATGSLLFVDPWCFIFTWVLVLFYFYMLTRQTLNWLSHLPSLQAWSMELNWLCSTPTSGAQKLWEFIWSTWTFFTLISSLATSREKKNTYSQGIFTYKEYENMIYRLNSVLGLNYKLLSFPSDIMFGAKDP